MAPWILLLAVGLTLYATWAMFRYSFRLIKRAHERARLEDKC